MSEDELNEVDNDGSESYTSDAISCTCTCDEDESDFQMCIDESDGLYSTTATDGIQELAEDEPSRLLGRSLKSLLWALLNWKSQSGVSATALSSLLAIISTFLCILTTLLPCLKPLSEEFPSSVARARAVVEIKQSVKHYTACRQCHRLYELQDCFETVGKRRVPRTCGFVEFPRHPQQQHRRPCGENLLREVVFQSGCKTYVPRRDYCYRGITKTLEEYLMRPGFAEACEEWRTRDVPPGTMADVYDGLMWKEFQYVDGCPFLAKPRNYAFMMNVDWFQPFKHTPYSVGFIYLVLLNLHRKVRFLKHNLFVIGIIPGPHEPSLHVNPYLEPLVDELEHLWEKGELFLSLALCPH